MKALLIADNKTAIDNVSQILESAGYDVIIYKWLIKALDNIEEICPHLIVVSAKDYPRHWKTLTQFASTSFGGYKPAVIVYAEGGLDEEEAQKAKTLGVRGVFESVDVKGLTDLREILAGKDDIYSGKLTEKEEIIEEEVISVDLLLNSDAEENCVVSEDEALAEEDSVVSEEEALTEEAPVVSEEEALTEEAPVDSEDETLSEEEPVVSEDEVLAEDEAVVSEDEVLAEDEAVVSEDEALTEEEALISEKDEVSEDKDIASDEDQITEDETVVTEEDSVTPEESEISESSPLTSFEEIEVQEDQTVSDEEPVLSEDTGFIENDTEDNEAEAEFEEDDFSVFEAAADETPKYCSFAFTNPVSGVLVTGYATNFDGKSFEFNADVDDFVKNLDNGVQIPWGAIKIDQEFASVCATVKSNQEVLVLELN